MLNEIEAVKSYLNGKYISPRAIDDYIYQISKYYKEQGKEKYEVRIIILNWLKENNLHFRDINNNIDNAYETKTKLKGDFKIYINKNDIECINNSADFNTVKKIALFLTIYSKINSDQDGWFKIRVSMLSEWAHSPFGKLNQRINQLCDYKFVEVPDHGGYEKYLRSKNGDKRMKMKICHEVINDGTYCIENNEDFENLFNRIFN